LQEPRRHVEVVRPIFFAALLAIVLGLLLAWVVPGGDLIVDVGAAVCALATWMVPLLVLARSWIRKPKGSLARVGVLIGAFTLAAMASVAGLALAVLSLFFARVAEWAWWSLLIIALFWLSGIALIAVFGRRRSEQSKSDPGGTGHS
jgi:hypothetical protein